MSNDSCSWCFWGLKTSVPVCTSCFLQTVLVDDALAVSLTDRINNEFSHQAGVFERSVLPVDVPEMKTAANFILWKTKEKDPE
ncbi:hypothetical protein CSA37_10395 [Candidatus Fermentibacteria bacterium]|nr:MAG: hypothetical protein CSA37_10395 [Candidatus Fermentibacteria bacterium]